MVAITRAALARQLQSKNKVGARVVKKKCTTKTKKTKKTMEPRALSSSKPYNEVAGKSNIIDAAQYDRYGNPTGREYDLGRDGAFNGFNILIAQLYSDFQFNDTAM